MQARLLDGLDTQLGRRIPLGEGTEVHEGHAVMLVVVRREAEVRVLVDDVRPRTAQYQSRISAIRLV